MNVPFAVWAHDFEWYAEPGSLPKPLCMTAVGPGGQRMRLWRDELLKCRRAPFPTGPDVVVTSYSLAADAVCWKVLGWPWPEHVMCAYAEHRVRYNGQASQFDDSLIGACARRGIAYLMTDAKERMRRRALDPAPFSEAEQHEFLDYCEEDSRACWRYVESLRDDIQWSRAFIYGRFALACAEIEHNGIPVDAPLLDLLRRHTGEVKLRLIGEGDRDFQCYEKGTLKAAKVWDFAKREGIPWPPLGTGAPATDKDTLKDLARTYPVVEGFRQLKKTVGALRANKYAADRDGRSHVSPHPFGTVTGRCAPKGSHFLFSGPAWMRGLVRPSRGTTLAYLDYESEEFAIAAALSGDERMLHAYQSGDPYLAVGVAMGIAPVGATKRTHSAIRDVCKVIVLGLGYGMERFGLARRLGITEDDAADLLSRHRRAFPVFWRWAEGQVAYAKAQRRISTPFGWQMHVPRNVNPRALLNWPMQAVGSDLLRLVATALVEDGVRVAALIHDAVLIEGPSKDFAGLVEQACATMRRASELVVGVPLRVDLGDEDNPHIFHYPARFRDKREGDMYDTARRLLLEAERLSA